jgi:very-long-chain ceramide synthase
MCVWIYLRHYLNLRIIFSLFTEFKTVGPYEINWETGQYKCTLSFVITLALLSSLQALNLFWLFFILRIAYRFAVHNVAKDDRSDAESEAEGEGDEINGVANGSVTANGAAKSPAAAAVANGVANGAAKKSR